MKARSYLPVLLLVPLLVASLAASPGIITLVYRYYVAPAGLTSGSCDSWANACDLQYALSKAYGNVGTTELWIKQGTYKPTATTDQSASFALKSGVELYGGFAGTETLRSQRNPASHPTILSGNIDTSGTNDSCHVLLGSSTDGTAVLDGFTITGANGTGCAYPAYYGGGMYISSGSPTLKNLIFANNKATYGGAIYTTNASAPKLTNVTFSGNTASQGGAMFNLFSSDPVLTNVTFSGNSATGYGGAIENFNGSSPTLTNVTFTGNTASIHGNAMYNGTNNAKPIIKDSILWGDGTQEIFIDTGGGATITRSIVQGGCPGGATCSTIVTADPKLGPLQKNGAFTPTRALGAGSAAIDKGDNATCAPKDQRGVARPQGGKCDLGAYEVKVLSFKSGGTDDGWVLESGETTSVGGSKDSASTTLRVGDDAANRQYRSVLSFNTSGVPDGATIVLARVKVMKAGIVGTDPFTTHGKLTLDLKKPFFGGAVGLEVGDFQATSTVTPAGGIGSTLVSGWYSGLLNSAGRAAVNKTGTTQLRLRFTIDDNNDSNADYLSLYSGNAVTADRPLLIVYYNP